MRLSLQAKLIAIVGVAAAAFVVLIVASSLIAERADRQLAAIRERFVPKIEIGPQLENQFEHLRRGIQDAVAAHDMESLAATQTLLDQFFNRLAASGHAIEPRDAAALQAAMEDYYEAVIPLSRRLITGETGEALLEAMTAMQTKQARAVKLLDAAVSFNRGELTAAFAAATRAQVIAGRVRLGTSIACLASVVFLSLLLGRGVLRSLRELSVGLRRFGGGDFSRPIPVLSQDEIGRVADQANQMARSLQNFAEQRDRGDWVKGALAGLGQELRGEMDPDDVGLRATNFLAGYLNAPAAALYYADHEGVLRLVGKYALAVGAGDGDVAPSFGFGEGLVGQAAMRNDMTLITDVPAGYMRVRSGLGEGEPQVIALLPLLHLNRVTGVLELGSFAPWSPRSTEALMAVRETLVIAIEVARARAAMRALLAETQRQTVRLTEQEEELRATNEELQSRQEELQQTNRELVEQAEELEIRGRELKENNVALDDARRTLEQKALQLETVSAYKSQFLANMSHELRTPLNSMLLLSSLMAENEGRNLTAKQVEFAKTIHVAGKDLLALINQVLDLAKIESGKYQIHVGSVSLRHVATDLRSIFEPLAQQKRLAFSVDVETDLPDVIQTDAQRLEQILKNLLANAIKFTDTGSVTLRIGRPVRDLRLLREDLRADSAVGFVVSDTGLGIAPDDQKRIFAPFEQVDSAADRRFGGTGLGLSISRELATLLGGELHLQSALGRGSTFTCVMPLDFAADASDADSPRPAAMAVSAVAAVAPAAGAWRVAVAAAPVTAASAQVAKPATNGIAADGHAQSVTPPIGTAVPSGAMPPLNDSCLLVVEDDPVFAEALADVIRGQGLECLVAGDGRSALRLVRERRPAGIVLDIKLPDIDGWQVMEELRADSTTAGIPVHFVSAMNASERGMALGAVGFLTKPATRADILRIVESLISKAQEPSLRVLIVEEDVATGAILLELLNRDNLDIRRVRHARDALARLDAERYGCIILNLSLPEMGGLDLLQTIRTRYGAGMPAVVVYSARALSEAETLALEAYAETVVLLEGASGERVVDEVRLFVRRLRDGGISGPTDVPPPRIRPGSIRLEGRKVLLVDDDMRTVYALSALLRSRGVDVATADNGQGALDLLDGRPDIEAILMDIMMPEMDGYEAMRRIRKDVRFRRLPIIALTAKAMKGDAQMCVDAGASDYLPKPVDPDRLLTLLHSRLIEGGADGA